MHFDFFEKKKKINKEIDVLHFEENFFIKFDETCLKLEDDARKAQQTKRHTYNGYIVEELYKGFEIICIMKFQKIMLVYNTRFFIGYF